VTEPAEASPAADGYGQANPAADGYGQASPAADGYGQAGRAADFGRRADQLPSGRHGLMPSFVAANQRERLLAAVTQASAELGYAEMSVEAIIARAGVSRRTFYEHFKNKEDAFLAAYDAAVHEAATRVRRAYLGETTALERLRAGIGAYLQFLASEPDTARMGIVEVLAAGPRAIARRADALRLFAEIIEVNICELVQSCRRPPLTAETMVGGIHEVVLSRILAGRTDELPGLADDLLVAILMLDVDPQELSRDS
jgi:AcrR family transcriptional regulator